MPISKEQMKITIKNLCLDVELFENFLQATQSVALEELKKALRTKL